ERAQEMKAKVTGATGYTHICVLHARMLYVSGPTERYPITSLADYVRRVRNEKNLSLAQVSARSRGQISKTHINRIENGTGTRVSLIKLRALARGLGVSEDALVAVAQG